MSIHTGKGHQHSSIMHLPVRCMITHFWVSASMTIMLIIMPNLCVYYIVHNRTNTLANFEAACTNPNENGNHQTLYVDIFMINNLSIHQILGDLMGLQANRLIHFRMDGFCTENTPYLPVCSVHFIF